MGILPLHHHHAYVWQCLGLLRKPACLVVVVVVAQHCYFLLMNALDSDEPGVCEGEGALAHPAQI